MTIAVKLVSSENNIRHVIIDIFAIFSLLTYSFHRSGKTLKWIHIC